MLRTIFSIGLFAVLGLIALKFIFGIFGLAVGLFFSLLFLALKIGLVLLYGFNAFKTIIAFLDHGNVWIALKVFFYHHSCQRFVVNYYCFHVVVVC